MKSILIALITTLMLFSKSEASMCGETLNNCIRDCGIYPEMCSTCQIMMNSCYEANRRIISNW